MGRRRWGGGWRVGVTDSGAYSFIGLEKYISLRVSSAWLLGWRCGERIPKGD